MEDKAKEDDENAAWQRLQDEQLAAALAKAAAVEAWIVAGSAAEMLRADRQRARRRDRKAGDLWQW